jgi:hypothetical protein
MHQGCAGTFQLIDTEPSRRSQNRRQNNPGTDALAVVKKASQIFLLLGIIKPPHFIRFYSSLKADTFPLHESGDESGVLELAREEHDTIFCVHFSHFVCFHARDTAEGTSNSFHEQLHQKHRVYAYLSFEG